MRTDDLVHRLFAVFDRRVAAIASLHRARRNMKITLTAFIFGGALVVLEAMGLAIVQATGARPPFIEYWGPLSAIGVGLVAYGTLRATLAAHKEYTAASLAEKASKDELRGLVRMIESIHDDLRSLRDLVEDRLSA